MVVNSDRTVNLALTPATQFYFNDFETGSVGSEWSRNTLDVTPRAYRRFLGQFTGNDVVTLTLTNLPNHTNLTLSFDFYMIRSWDGNSPSAFSEGPDIFDVTVVGQTNLLHTTFASDPSLLSISTNQAYPSSYPLGSFVAGTGASEIQTLGYFYQGNPADAVYHLTFTFPHNSNSVSVQFSSALFEFGAVSKIGNESWGLDNVSVSGGGAQLNAPVPNSLYLGSYSNAVLTITNNDLVDLVAGTVDGVFTHPLGADGPVYSIAAATNSAVTVRAARSIFVTLAPLYRVTPCFTYQPSPWITISSNDFSPDSTGDSMMRS